LRKKILLFAISTILSINCYSQMVFENGYFINESNQKVDCLIKNIDWKNNPTDFEYKLSQKADIKKADIQIVKEFGINGVSKYIRALVKLDRSGDNVNDELSTDRNPIFNEEQLFLKVLIEGKASLFLYEDGNLKRLFYKMADSEVKQLVYKVYLTKENDLARNNHFRQQLFLDLKCQDIRMNEIERIGYNERDLCRFFVRYNECDNSQYVNFEAKQKKDLFNLTIRPGINISSLSIQNSIAAPRDTDFSTSYNFRFGVEAEFILPFNKNKWSLIIEPTYQYFKSEITTKTSNVPGGMLTANVDYKSIELPFGIRHYFFLKNGFKIFTNASYIIDFSSKSSIPFIRSNGSELSSLDVKSRNNLAIGIGCKHKDKYSLEMRYQTNRNILDGYTYWNSDYKTVSVIFGYSFF
jgi:hypothetical protein